jgi:anthranilate synthase/aminodeoxychorismate synthase-like glutamine amidotransferase
VKPAPPSSVPPIVNVVLLDSHDSFTWNLAQGFEELGASVAVVDAALATVGSILEARPQLVCLGPGPSGPADMPALTALVRGLDGRVATLGVCLGLQALVLAHDGAVGRARAPVHGKRDLVEHDGQGIFAGLPSPLWVMRYHSLVATAVPSRFAITARDRDGQVMGLRDPAARIEAVQFHPESIGTAGGLEMLRSALAAAGFPARAPLHRRGAFPPPDAPGPGHPEALYVASPERADWGRTR